MDPLRRHFPWLTPDDEIWLRGELLRRAALGYEQGEAWRDAAECWAELNRHDRAGELYARAGDLAQAAASYLTAGQYAAALAAYTAWAAQLPAADSVAQVEALLGQAACHLLGAQQPGGGAPLTEAAGRAAYRRAREMLDALASRDGAAAARGWQALAEYGDRLERYDLVEMGYEQGLASLGAAGLTAAQIRLGESYLAVVRRWGDRLLAQAIEERLAAWGGEEAEPLAAWELARQRLESYPFRDGVHDVLHFSHPAQEAAWAELAELEEQPAVDAYLRALAPAGMVYIPAGTFLMGSAADDAEANADEKPQHEVRLRGYYMDRTPVTNAAYRVFIESGGYSRREYWSDEGWRQKEANSWQTPRLWNDVNYNGDRQPVVGVSWYEALAYATWAGKALPTEAHWEKAAGWDPVARRKRHYPWGDVFDSSKYVWRPDNWPPVGDISLAATNAYGIADMAGIYTWCSSKNLAYPYQAGDGRETLDGEAIRVLRGGGSQGGYARCGFRFWYYPRGRDLNRGFRCIAPHVFSSSGSGS